MKQFVVHEKESIRNSLQKIELNKHGIIAVVDDEDSVIGLATDGDIRRSLLEGRSLDSFISECINRNFVWAEQGVARESLLKQLDSNIKIIPILDKKRRLVALLDKEFAANHNEENVYSRSRAPVRVSFGGGGSDLTHFFVDYDGAVINATISLYTHATLRKRNDTHILVHSMDLNDSLQADDLQEALQKKGKFGLIQAVLKVIQPDFGFELYLNSDYPIGSGLGGSAVVATAIFGCFNEFRIDKWNSYEIAEMAFQAERFILGVNGGWQDQYASVFGGFNFIEFKKRQNLVHPLRIKDDILLELEESLVLCDTGVNHDSGDIHANQKIEMQESSIQERVKTNVELTFEIRNNLLRGNLMGVGKNLDEAWQLKRTFSSKISNVFLDKVYDLAIQNGAVGGKLLGAGGGGYFLFYVTPFEKHRLINALQANGMRVERFKFDQDGLKSWKSRENK